MLRDVLKVVARVQKARRVFGAAEALEPAGQFVVVRRLRRGLARPQQGGELAVAGCLGERVGRVPALARLRQGGAHAQQRVHRVGVALDGRVVERREARAVAQVDVGAGGDERAHDLGVPVARRDVQRRLPRHARRRRLRVEVDARAGRQHRLDAGLVPLGGEQLQRVPVLKLERLVDRATARLHPRRDRHVLAVPRRLDREWRGGHGS
mmetsp:Transcript_2440/g.4880  ORF Transcript_2440/g.4880 Transcript_2440/m.4880 type:complete len:209 (-) Transcript_2440:29-655(-)